MLFLFALGFSSISFGQVGSSYGIRAGLNYNSNGDLFNAIDDAIENPEKNMGFHIGVFGKFGNRLYIKPEFVYTNTKSKYDSGDFNMQKLDLPVLAGIKIIGPLHIFLGPSFQYILSSKFEGVSSDDIDQKFSVGFNFGAGVNLGRIGIDLRYERGFSSNEISFLGNNGIDISKLETRPEQLILSLSVAL
ncbi:MAG: PorT family protein [Flavobacteriaceae bacterium]|nr:PorT family protein [Flavobacteriaceae bacterium]